MVGSGGGRLSVFHAIENPGGFLKPRTGIPERAPQLGSRLVRGPASLDVNDCPVLRRANHGAELFDDGRLPVFTACRCRCAGAERIGINRRLAVENLRRRFFRALSLGLTTITATTMRTTARTPISGTPIFAPPMESPFKERSQSTN
ncbi:hypothetical protein AHiyo1_06160 [Arthrobacter sp. Hiyo1]|nr:hypothetical protein AHiyo1_06160 [Arthrobacter sp. Hiyo1]